MKKFLTTCMISCFLFSTTSNAHAKKTTDINIKVGIIPQTSNIIPISSSGQGGIFAIENGEILKVYDIQPRQVLSVNNKNGIIEVFDDNKKVISRKGKLLIKSIDNDYKYEPLIFAGNHWYRGTIEIFPSLKNPKTTTVVNTLPIEEYLYGVVPSEMPTSWPLEALKTQAVAARTYAMKNIGQYLSEGYDLTATVMSQVYDGAEVENPTSNQAVDETIGKVATYNSKLINAYYSSGGGGITESGLDAWGNDLPYLKSVKDFDFDSPKYSWYKSITNEALQFFIKKEYKVSVGKVTSVTILDTTSSGRAKTVRIKGLNGVVDVDAKKLRIALKLNSTLFQISVAELGTIEENNVPIPELFLISGKGFGHGSGMSQYGSRYLAKSGKSYQEIIKYYYQGVEVSDYTQNK